MPEKNVTFPVAIPDVVTEAVRVSMVPCGAFHAETVKEVLLATGFGPPPPPLGGEDPPLPPQEIKESAQAIITTHAVPRELLPRPKTAQMPTIHNPNTHHEID